MSTTVHSGEMDAEGFSEAVISRAVSAWTLPDLVARRFGVDKATRVACRFGVAALPLRPIGNSARQSGDVNRRSLLRGCRELACPARQEGGLMSALASEAGHSAGGSASRVGAGAPIAVARNAGRAATKCSRQATSPEIRRNHRGCPGAFRCGTRYDSIHILLSLPS